MKTNQGKVSMVISCYNKEKWIAKMLDSVISQSWDNLEVVLVNDGSTDRTMEIIMNYEKKILERGYQVVIIEQMNQGVAMAVKQGLMKVTGDYVCIVDCDDILNKDYVYFLCSALERYLEINCAVCDSLKKRWDYGYVPYKEKEDSLNIVCNKNKNLLKNYLVHRLFTSVCLLMFRTSLLDSIQILSRFITNVHSTQEPQVWLPILITQNSIIHVQRPLYQCVRREKSLTSSLNTIEDICIFAEEWCDLSKKVMLKYKDYIFDTEYYENILCISKYNIVARCLSYTHSLSEITSIITTDFVNSVNQSGLIPIFLKKRKVLKAGFFIAYHAICNYILSVHVENLHNLEMIKNTTGNIVLYAEKGTERYLIPILLNCGIYPNQILFKNRDVCYEYTFDELSVCLASGPEDIIIILLKGEENNNIALNSKRIYYQELLDEISSVFFLI